LTQRRHTTLVAAGATILAALPLSTVFENWTWLIQVLLVVAVMTGTALALRSLRTPGWLPTVGMAVAYLLSLTWLYADKALLGIIPSVATIQDFNQKLVDAGVAIQENGVPVADDPGLLFLAGLGIGAVLISIDLAAVVARRPAIAGLPMVAIYLVAVGTHGDSVSFLSFVSTAAAFLWLLATDNVDRVRRFGRRFTGDGRDVDVWEPSPLAAAGRRLAVVGVAAAVLLPLAIPGMTTGLLDRFGTGVGSGAGGGSGKGSGRGGTVNLFALLSGSLVRDKSYTMVKVTTNDPNPFYLRFAVAEDLTAAGFTNRSNGPGTPLSSLTAPNPPTANGVTSHGYRAEVEIVNFDMPFLPVYEQPTKVSKLNREWWWDKRTSVLYSPRENSKGKKYQFDYVRVDYTQAALQGAAPLSQNDANQQFTRTPDVKPVRDKAEELTKGKKTQYDKVRAIYDFFTKPENGFRYDPNTKIGNSGSQMVDFLTNKVGYCEQYAAAMGWLVRAIGIPARVAFGFTRGSDSNGNTRTLNNYNLHAWTEVYFDGFGWIPFDATPASSIAGSVSTQWAPDPSRSLLGGQRDPSDDPLTPVDPDPSASAGADPNRPEPGANGPAGVIGGSTLPRWPFYLLGGLLIALVLLSLPAARRSALRRRRRPGASGPADLMVAQSTGDSDGPPPDPGHPRARRDAHAAWNELIDTMTDFRIVIDPAETPRATVVRLVRERRFDGAAQEGADLLGRAEERARYARAPLTDVQLAPAMSAVRSALREQVSTRTRLLATVFPRSVLLRWRAASITKSTRFMNSVATRRDAISRVVSPRRLLVGRSRG
jgi:transglutaminase-like putative cysteine protease